jgi:hypothetical protein
MAGNQDLCGSYKVPRSLRFVASRNHYLTRTQAASGNRRKFAFSFWYKKGQLKASAIISAVINSQNYFLIGPNASGIGTTDGLEISQGVGNVLQWRVQTNMIFRDPAAWYHVHIQFDTDNAVASDRVIITVNGVRQTLNGTYPTQGFDIRFLNEATYAVEIGRYSPSTAYNYDGLISEFRFFDGMISSPTDVAFFCPATGQWLPKEYKGAYGTYGYYLKFNDWSSSSAPGLDSSGNNLNFTVSPNCTITRTHYLCDIYDDSPTKNFATLNSLAYRWAYKSASYTNGNLMVTGGSPNYDYHSSTMQVSGQKWYWEVLVGSLGTGTFTVGVANETSVQNGSFTDIVSYNSDGTKNVAGVNSAYGAAYVANDVIGVALDMDSLKVTFYKNGVSQGSISLPTTLAVGATGSSVSGVAYYNFGQTPFAYSVPTGYLTLCPSNLFDPKIFRPEKYFKARTYLGNGAGLQVGEIQKAVDLFPIGQSLRFRSASADYLSRTPTISSNRTTWTWSGWVKRSKLGGGWLFGSNNSNNQAYTGITFDANDKIYLLTGTTVPSNPHLATSNQVFKDTTKWVHIVSTLDANNSDPTKRWRVWADGVELAMTVTAQMAQGLALNINASQEHCLGRQGGGTAAGYFEGYMADVNFVDGQVLDPTSFGQWDANGYWIPKSYDGSYGTNGFHVNFADKSGTTLTTLGKDISGNGNNWNPYNFSVAAGTTLDVLDDSPTNNYAVLDQGRAVLSTGNTYNAGIYNGGLNINCAYDGGVGTAPASIAVASGKWYYESSLALNSGAGQMLMGFYSLNTALAANQGYWIGNGGNLASGDGIWGCAIDWDKGYIWFRNAAGNWVSGDPVLGTSPSLTFAPGTIGSFYCGAGRTSGYNGSPNVWVNFGQRPFAYSVPTGYAALCENNVAEYTYDIETPDLVWIKSRSTTTNHMLFDSTRGPGKSVSTNLTAAEANDPNSLIKFDKNGFYLGNNTSVNALSGSFVAWTWKEGVTPGLDIVTYTGNGVNGRQIPHSLGKVPSLIIEKDLTAGTFAWSVQGCGKLWSPATSNLFFNTTNGLNPAGAYGAPTADYFYPSLTSYANVNGNQNVAYVFAEVPGFSKFGSYTGNGSTDGTFVNCGFRPAFVMVKAISTGGSGFDWIMVDNSRESFNPEQTPLWADLTSAEATSAQMDFLSNGFKLRAGAGSGGNSSGVSYIFMAFAEAPFKFSNAR